MAHDTSRLTRTVTRSRTGAGANATKSDARAASDSRIVERDIDRFLARFEPGVERLARDVRRWMQRRLPTAIEMVYDNYNALVFGFVPSERPSDAIFSVAVYPRYVSVFFLQGAGLPDPEGLLQGSGSQVRHLRVGDVADLERPAVTALVAAALDDAVVPMPRGGRGTVIIRSISAKRRARAPAPPRRPSST